MQSFIHREQKAKEVINFVMRRENETTSLSFFSSDVNLEEGSTFETCSSDLKTLLISLLARGNAEQCAHGLFGEAAGEQERSQILMLGDEDSADDECSNFVDNPEGITYRDGVLSIGYKILMNILSLPFTLFRLPCPVIYKPKKTYNRIMAMLIQLEDNGNFDEFDRCSSNVIKLYENVDPDIVAAVTVEQAQCYLYRKNLRAAKICAKRGLVLAQYTRFPPKFQARALILMSTICRKSNKLGSTEKKLELAKQNLKSGWDYEDMAHFYECHGSYLDALMGKMSQPDDSIKDLALTSFKKMSEIALQDTRLRVRDKNRFYALIKSARVLLDSNSSFGRKARAVSEDSIVLASQHLEVIKRYLWNSIPRGSQIQFRLVESDLYFRQGKFEEERSLLMQCLDEAKSYGFKTELPIIIQRMKDMDQMQTKLTPCFVKMNDVVETIVHNDDVQSSNSDKESGDENSSDSSSDIFSSKYL